MPSAKFCSAAPTGWTESDRLAELESLDLTVNGQEAVYDDLTRIAALVCHAPISLVSLVEAERQWFKARVGFDLPETPRQMSICSHAIESNALLVIPDLERFPRSLSRCGEVSVDP